MADFASRWNVKRRSVNSRLKEKIRGKISPPRPLRLTLGKAKISIEQQLQRLDEIVKKLREKDQRLIEGIRVKIRRRDRQHAAVLAGEVVEVRRILKMVEQARCALEGIVLRIGTVQEMGDIVYTLTPAVEAVRSIQSDIVGVVPAAEESFTEIADMLKGILIDAEQSSGVNVSFTVANKEAGKILNEAFAVAKQRLEEKLPEIPADIPDDIASPLREALA